MGHSAKLIAFLALAPLAGCQRAEPSLQLTQPSSNQHSRDVRYTATLALAFRGSDKIKDQVAWDLLLEMLDEDKTLQDFRSTLPDGREVANEAAARETTLGALRAVQELHRKQPHMDLAQLNPALEKLAASKNRAVSTQAKQVQQALAPS